MYVPKPGVGPFKRDLVRLGGEAGNPTKKVTPGEDFLLYKTFEPGDSASGNAITITYPSGDSFWIGGRPEKYAEEVCLFLPKGTVISHPYGVQATGYYVVPASSVGGVNPYAKHRSPLRRAA